ncbi:hypothetical protein C9J03_26050 [Photobacterium gaetbulicola]|uniref:Outer membrane protein beta-barrel domain-containing protein n=1 Tax=Photobacterium gaetbulicola Gung47 TaxID=658445 RepID=A0A0C5WJ50_9GAMM|nr:hypothetical protein [Photobacterium gaetbulicola]AJR06207.1 hypothetical protein H744_1c1182 [Photobacterium gaetbulicola Gung47]PST98823.1 hypothetical protein C9J03_26050 [Photobacterium gaetbulicola]
MNKRLLLILLLSSIQPKVFAEQEVENQDKVNMADPTAVYSSVGMGIAANGDVDASFGLAFGKHGMSLESKKGFDELKARYYWMNEGQGFYTEGYFGGDVESLTGGYVATWKAMEKVTFYPVLTIGVNKNQVTDDSIAIGMAGFYSRINHNAWHIGFDNFYSFGEDDYDLYTYDAFVGYQIKNHRIRAGYDSNEEAYLKWQMAF